MNFAYPYYEIAIDMLFDTANHTLNHCVTQHVNDALNHRYVLNVYRTVNEHLNLIQVRRLLAVSFLR